MAGQNYKPNPYRGSALLIRCIVLLVALVFGITCQAGTIYLHDKSGKVQLLGKTDLAIDIGGKVMFGLHDSLVWQPAERVKSLSFGYSRDVYWLRFDVRNTSLTNRYLIFVHPVLDNVTLQCVDAAGRVVQHEQQGDGFAFSGRAIPLSPISFRLPDLPDYRCVVRIATTSTAMLDGYIVDGVGLASNVAVEYIKMGATNAAVLAIAVFLLASIAFRRSALLPVYAVAATSIALWNATNSGVGAHLFWPNSVWWQNNGAAISGTLAYAGISAYVWLILRRKAGLQRVSLVAAGAMAVWIAVCLATFWQQRYPVVLELYAPLGFAHAVIMVAMMIYASVIRRDFGLYILTAGQISFAAPSILVALLMAGWLPPVAWLRSLLPFGFVAELFFLALSLAYESELIKRKVDVLQRQQIKEAELAKDRQEEAVAERTGEISNIVGAAIHDVVAPLHNLADTLINMDSHVDANVRPQLHSAIELVTRLSIIASNIYAFERFREGSGVDHPPNIIAVDVCELIRRHVHSARLSMSGRVCLVDGEPGIMAACDAHEIGRLMDNMLSNFWRHTHEGATMVIRIAVVDHNIVIQFEDDGEGLMALRYRMDDFAKGKMTRGKVGGIYNCMRYAKRNGGCLRYKDSSMGGACFVLTLLRYMDGTTQ